MDNDYFDLGEFNERVSSPDDGYSSSSPGEPCEFYNQPTICSAVEVEGIKVEIDVEEIGKGKRKRGRPRQASVEDEAGAERSRAEM